MDEVRVVQAAYEEIAPTYLERFGRDFLSLDHDTAIIGAVAAEARRLGGPVLDLGCGPAHVAAHAATTAGVAAIGVDLTPAMLAAAEPTAGVSLVAGDLARLPIRQGAAGGALLFYVLHHVDPDGLVPVLSRVRAVLRDGARLALVTHVGGMRNVTAPGLHQHLHTEPSVRAALAAAGFDVLSTHERDPLPHETRRRRVYVEAAAP